MESHTKFCIIGILVVLSIGFIIIGHEFREQIQLRLKSRLFTLPKCTIDWWSITHAGLFFLFGIIAPENHAKFFILGIIWELIEDCMASEPSTQLVDCACKNRGVLKSMWCRGRPGDYWYANIWDPVINLLGYTLGSALATSIAIKVHSRRR